MAVLIKEILNKMIEENAQMPRILWEFKISNAWGKINPANVAENSAPDKLIGGILYVNAKNSAWAQQINLLKSDIMLKLNAFMGEQAVKDIRLKTGLVGIPSQDTREKPKKNCVECNVEFFGDEALCPSCFRKANHKKNVALLRLVEQNPKIGLHDAGNFVAGTSEVELHRAKRDVLARKADQNYRTRRNRGLKKGN
jgi:hypothetical protein